MLQPRGGGIGKPGTEVPGHLPKEIRVPQGTPLSAGLAGPSCLALLAGTPIPQKLPRINPQFVVIVEMKFDRVFAHAFRRNRFDRGLVHGQGPSGKFWRLSRLLVRLGSRFVAQRARTSIAQERKGIMRPMAILPFDVEPGAAAQIHFYRLGVCHHRHKSSIAYLMAPSPPPPGNCRKVFDTQYPVVAMV
jgi:hypothetical protein